MKLSTWSPSYTIKEVKVTQAEGNLKLSIAEKGRLIGSAADEIEGTEYSKEEIAITVLGMVDFYKPQYSHLGSIVKGIINVLDSFDDLGIECQQFVKCSYLENGLELLGELSDFDGENYESPCSNPIHGTNIFDGLENKKVLLVAGIESEQMVMQYVNSLNAMRQAETLALEHVLVVNDCTSSVGKQRTERDLWAKYIMEKNGSTIIDLYRGETRIA